MTAALVDRWRVSQENRAVASQILQMAHRLGVPDVDRWCAGVLTQARQRGMPDDKRLLQAVQLAVLGRQSESPTAAAVLSVADIRRLADERSGAQPAVDPATRARQPNRRTDDTAASPPRAVVNPEWAPALPALSGTDLIRNGQLTIEAVTKLHDARQALARETGQPPASIPPATAALQVASDHWTTRITSDAGAFDKARLAQDALTRAMGPLRVQAAHQRALVQTDRDYDATLASIKVLAPTFVEGRIAETKVGEVTLAQLRSSMPAEQFASLRLDVARRYLAHYQAQGDTNATASAKDPAQAFLAKVKPEVRKRWEMQLIGGPALSDVVRAEALRGGALTVERIERATLAMQHEPLLPALPRAGDRIEPNKFYELRYQGAPDLRTQLKIAMRNYGELPMQIRTADGSRRLDIYRHGGEQTGTTIIDHRDGSALTQPAGSIPAILDSLNIKGGNHGGLVISYGSADAVLADRPNIYPDPRVVMRERAAEQALPLRGRLSQIDGEYTAFVRKLDTSLLVESWGDSMQSTPVRAWEERASLKKRAVRLECDWPQAIDKRGEMPAAAQLLNFSQMTGWFREVEETASGERQPDPPPGQSVTERRLATIRELVSRTPGLPDDMRGPLGEAKLLVAALRDFYSLKRDRTLVDNGTLTESQFAQMLTTPRKYFDFLLHNPAAWQHVIQKALPNR